MHLLGCRRLRTTAYHPQANGIIERFHRQLKNSLKATPSPIHWVDHLPLIMLGLRSAVKVDSGFSPAEMVYGSELRLPGDFFAVCPLADSAPAVAPYVARLKQSLLQLRPVQSRTVTPPDSLYVPSDLHTADRVFIRCDAVRKPLQRPYDGPYSVVSRGSKTFTVSVKGQPQVIAIDRLKPAIVAS